MQVPTTSTTVVALNSPTVTSITALSHIVGDAVCDIGTIALNALQNASVFSIEDFVQLNTEELCKLKYVDSSSNLQPLRLGHTHRLRVAREFCIVKYTSFGNNYAKYLSISKEEYTTFILENAKFSLAIMSKSPSSSVPTVGFHIVLFTYTTCDIRNV